MTNLLFLCLQRREEMSEGCKIILAGRIKMLLNTHTCIDTHVHTCVRTYTHWSISFYTHIHNFKDKHSLIFSLLQR